MGGVWGGGLSPSWRDTARAERHTVVAMLACLDATLLFSPQYYLGSFNSFT